MEPLGIQKSVTILVGNKAPAIPYTNTKIRFRKNKQREPHRAPRGKGITNSADGKWRRCYCRWTGVPAMEPPTLITRM